MCFKSLTPGYLYALQNYICQSILTSVLSNNHQLGSSTGPASLEPIAPAMPVSPNVPSTINRQIAPVEAPHLATTNIATRNQIAPAKVLNTPSIDCTPGLTIAPNVFSLTRCQIAPVKAPHTPILHNVQGLPTAPNVTVAVEYELAPARPPTPKGLQQNPDSIGQHYLMTPAYSYPKLPSTLPRKMRTVECSVCKTKSQTDEYTYVDCSNPNCYRRICLLDDCFQRISKLHSHGFVAHQYRKHLKNANPYKCYSCKAPKHRG